MSAESIRVLQSPPQAVVVVGAGGTGGVLIQQLCRLLYGIADLSDRARDAPRLPGDEDEEEFDPYAAGAPELIIVDGDNVEPSNLRRQFFIDTDAHKTKAIVLAERYSAAFGLAVSAYPHYLTPEISKDDLEEVLPARSVVVGAVDNAATRCFLHERLDTYSDVVYLDSGNAGIPATGGERSSELDAGEAGYDGQVVCGARMDHHKVLPFPAEVFPDLIDVEDPEDRLPTDIPCGEVIVSNPQRQVTNVYAATVLLSYLTPILTEGVVPNSLTFFDARKGYLRSQSAPAPA
ncbi:MAG: ThiF family adenylyltransferase [Rubrobacter sp.]|nr:ThiF family adenylyltransferase [Rubrobacter sp.]